MFPIIYLVYSVNMSTNKNKQGLIKFQNIATYNAWLVCDPWSSGPQTQVVIDHNLRIPWIIYYISLKVL